MYTAAAVQGQYPVCVGILQSTKRAGHDVQLPCLMITVAALHAWEGGTPLLSLMC